MGAGLCVAWFLKRERNKETFKFAHQISKESDWVPLWAPHFEERPDLANLKDATGGRFAAHHVRAVPGQHMGIGDWHVHDVEMQFVYILKGEVTFEYENIGEVTLRQNDCVMQPCRIKHREVSHSDDAEILEVVTGPETSGAPTEVVDAPTPVARRR
jgi:mannose-6-phosphate isomerase-like protein (cupin superfamily)